MNRCKLEHKENNVVTVTNNNVKYYENLAKQHADESKKYSLKSENFSKEAIAFINSHIENIENPHNVTAEQVGAYSTSEIDEILTDELAKKNPNLVAGQNIVISDNADGTQTISSENLVSTNYEIVENKPSINMVSLVGNKSSNDLGLASIEDIPTKVSEFQNDAGYLTSHQDISGKQDVLDSGDGILIENNTISTINRADIDLSNLSDVGKNAIDGQWVDKDIELSTAKAIDTYILDVSEHLPNDDSIYEVLVSYNCGYVGSAYISFSTDLMSEVEFSIAAASSWVNGLILLPLHEKSIIFKIKTHALSNCTVELKMFRRIGTNE